jgi:hypothetical protein
LVSRRLLFWGVQARSSFLSSVHACALISALGAFGLALFTARALRVESQAS